MRDTSLGDLLSPITSRLQHDSSGSGEVHRKGERESEEEQDAVNKGKEEEERGEREKKEKRERERKERVWRSVEGLRRRREGVDG